MDKSMSRYEKEKQKKLIKKQMDHAIEAAIDKVMKKHKIYKKVKE